MRKPGSRGRERNVDDGGEAVYDGPFTHQLPISWLSDKWFLADPLVRYPTEAPREFNCLTAVTEDTLAQIAVPGEFAACDKQQSMEDAR